MVDADGRHSPGIAQALGDRRPDHERPHQARTRRVGDPGDGLRSRPGLPEGGLDHGQQPPDVIAGGEFRDHPTPGPVQVELAEDGVCEEPGLAVIDRHGGLVAGGLDPEHPRGRTPP